LERVAKKEKRRRRCPAKGLDRSRPRLF
jgi:hypothetical protein